MPFKISIPFTLSAVTLIALSVLHNSATLTLCLSLLSLIAISSLVWTAQTYLTLLKKTHSTLKNTLSEQEQYLKAIKFSPKNFEKILSALIHQEAQRKKVLVQIEEQMNIQQKVLYETVSKSKEQDTFTALSIEKITTLAQKIATSTEHSQDYLVQIFAHASKINESITAQQKTLSSTAQLLLNTQEQQLVLSDHIADASHASKHACTHSKQYLRAVTELFTTLKTLRAPAGIMKRTTTLLSAESKKLMALMESLKKIEPVVEHLTQLKEADLSTNTPAHSSTIKNITEKLAPIATMLSTTLSTVQKEIEAYQLYTAQTAHTMSKGVLLASMAEEAAQKTHTHITAIENHVITAADTIDTQKTTSEKMHDSFTQIQLNIQTFVNDTEQLLQNLDAVSTLSKHVHNSVVNLSEHGLTTPKTSNNMPNWITHINPKNPETKGYYKVLCSLVNTIHTELLSKNTQTIPKGYLQELHLYAEKLIDKEDLCAPQQNYQSTMARKAMHKELKNYIYTLEHTINKGNVISAIEAALALKTFLLQSITTPQTEIYTPDIEPAQDNVVA